MNSLVHVGVYHCVVVLLELNLNLPKLEYKKCCKKLVDFVLMVFRSISRTSLNAIRIVE